MHRCNSLNFIVRIIALRASSEAYYDYCPYVVSKLFRILRLHRKNATGVFERVTDLLQTESYLFKRNVLLAEIQDKIPVGKWIYPFSMELQESVGFFLGSSAKSQNVSNQYSD